MSPEYILGTSDHELERLRLQHDVWKPATEGFLSRLEIPAGARCLDVGCGPGFTTAALRDRAGPEGEVVALDESERWLRALEERSEREGWSNVRTVRARVEEAELEPGSFDLVHLRWVLAFLPDPAAVLARLARLLRPGGTVAVIDYNHEGVSLFPASEGFRAAIRATRELYARSGGDTWIMGRIAGLFRGAGLERTLLEPHVLCGDPSSPAFRWADAFFPHHLDGMVASGVLTFAERELFLREWEERREDPDALFFSPIVVGAAARLPERP